MPLQPKLISFTVGGLFKEFCSNTDSDESSDGEVRFFERQYIIVPAGGGFCIRNEMIFISNATTTQSRSFLKPLPVIAPTPQTPAATTTATMSTMTMGNAAAFPNPTIHNNQGVNMQSASMTMVGGGVTSLQSRLQLQQPAAAAMNVGGTAIAPNVASVMGVNPNGTPLPPSYPGSSTQTFTPDAAKLQLVQALSAQSNMNLDWSKK